MAGAYSVGDTITTAAGLSLGFHKAQPPRAGTPASIFLAMWLNLQWQCKCSASRVEYIESAYRSEIFSRVLRVLRMLSVTFVLLTRPNVNQEECEPFLTLTDFYICLTHLRTRLTLQALQPQSSQPSTLTSTEASPVLSPYQLGTLRTRTMSLPELDPCQAEHTEIACFSSDTRWKYKKGGV